MPHRKRLRCIMDKWIKVKISDLGQVVGGATPSTKKDEYYNGDIAWITPKDLSDFKCRYISRGERNITKAGMDSCSTQLLPKNTVLFSSRAPIGYVAIAENEMCTNQGFKSVIPNENIDCLFLYYLLKFNKDKIEAMGSGTTFKEVSGSTMRNIEVTIPESKKVQVRIAAILDAIDSKIENNIKINNDLEQQAMALFKSWFIDYEPFDGQVPTTWKYGVLGDFVEIKRGGSPRPIQNFLSDSGLHWLKISDATGISSPFINEIKEYIIEEGLKKTVFLKAGSLVLSNSATPGLPKILDIDTCIHDGWLYFPSSKFSNEYLYLYFKHIRDNLVALGNGSVFTNLKTDILKNYPTSLPTDEVLNEFDEIIKPIFSMILSKARESKRLTEIRDTLLPRLMSGKLDVSDIDL